MSSAAVSVVIPVRDLDYAVLKRAVASALKQDVSVEVVVVDDCSDFIPEDVQTYLADNNVVFSRNTGVMTCAGARNRGIELATNELIVPLDADDELYPNVLGRYADESADADVLHGDVTVIWEDNGNLRRTYGAPTVVVPRMFVKWNPLPSTVMFKKQDWLSVGKYTVAPDGMIWETWRFYAQLALAGKTFKRVDKPLVIRHVRPISLSAQIRRNAKLASDRTLAGLVFPS